MPAARQGGGEGKKREGERFLRYLRVNYRVAGEGGREGGRGGSIYLNVRRTYVKAASGRSAFPRLFKLDSRGVDSDKDPTDVSTSVQRAPSLLNHRR